MSYTFTASLKGSEYVEQNYRKFCSGIDHRVRLEFEPDNPYDRNAVKVLGGPEELFIGYLDRDSAAKIRRMKSKHPQAEAVFSDGKNCYALNVTLEVDPPVRKKAPQTAVVVSENVIVGYLVKTKLPAEKLRDISGELAIIPEGGGYSVRQMHSGDLIGTLDAKTAAVLEHSEVPITQCAVFDFSEERLFVQITTDGRLLSDLEWQQKRIAGLFKKMPEYLGYQFGKDPPTASQFSYGLALGIDMRNQTFQSISKAIDKAKALGIPARHTLEDWEEKELYRYLSRQSNQRYAFLDSINNSPWRSKDRLRPAASAAPDPEPPPQPEPPPDYKTECPFCGQHYECPAEMNGAVQKCVHCGQEFRIRLDAPTIPPGHRPTPKRMDASWIVLAVVLILLAVYLISRF